MITPSQCRAARALLGWSQEELETAARVSKKTIADFERDQRNQQARTIDAIEVALNSAGIIFIPQNGGGEGVRKRGAMPRLFRRDDVEHREWVAFAFDYKQQRFTGFVSYQALVGIALSNIAPIAAFDRDVARILIAAADKVDKSDFDPEGRVLLTRNDLPPIEFDPNVARKTIGRTRLHLIGRRRFTAVTGAVVDPIDYNGFRVRFGDGSTKTYLKLRAGDGDHDALDVSAEIVAGFFIVSERNDCPFSVGDRVRLIRGQQRPEISAGDIGTVCEVEDYPIMMGPAPRIRVGFGSHITAWETPTQFEMAI
ncbi:helix-turn-helix domain-containing protein [Bradyrhizobium tropiciagri]|uniref:helix-turn-helix domain-containing protein n=1 Tax=Bradyrhizobium tropiciagri TaxID=312253 RepID=UPI000ABDA82B|nr:helix-turn-helix transcriptional regulator [Bradyrhizobium tropiciagri]